MVYGLGLKLRDGCVELCGCRVCEGFGLSIEGSW